jgi:hypothetical protein
MLMSLGWKPIVRPLMRLSEPGVAPLSRAYPRLDECRPDWTHTKDMHSTLYLHCSLVNFLQEQ